MWSRTILVLFVFSITGMRGLAAEQEVYYFKKLLIADTEEKVASLAATAGGEAPTYVQDVPVLSGADFQIVIRPYLGRRITNDLLNALAKTITDYSQKHDRIVRFNIPTQDISLGVVRFVVLTGRYNDLVFRGNRWFSSKLLQERLGIKPGDEVRLSALEAAVNWANTNPFRHI
jgi:hemolysin activation/secretion protein